MFLFSLVACQSQEKKKPTEIKSETAQLSPKKGEFKVTKTDAEWRKVLTQEQYDVLRQKATERPFTGEYYKNFKKGVYVCAACGNH